MIRAAGLDPTHDDRTREAIGAATCSEMLRDQDHTDNIRARLTQAGRSVTANTLRMADYPAGAEAGIKGPIRFIADHPKMGQEVDIDPGGDHNLAVRL